MKLLFSFIKNKSDKMGRIELTNLTRMYKLVLEKVEELEIKLPTSIGS